MKVVAFVPIRLNSKRVVGKNLKPLGGKPLMWYILETLAKVKNIDEVYVYCSSEEIIPHLPEGKQGMLSGENFAEIGVGFIQRIGLIDHQLGFFLLAGRNTAIDDDR